MLIEELNKVKKMKWKDIIKAPQMTDAQNQQASGQTGSVVEDDVSQQGSEYDATTVASTARRSAMGRYKELTDQVATLASQARIETTNQKVLLGNIRFLLRKANIPEVSV